MPLQKFGKHRVGPVQRGDDGQAKALPNLGKEFAHTRRGLALVDQLQPASASPSHVLLDEENRRFDCKVNYWVRGSVSHYPCAKRTGHKRPELCELQNLSRTIAG